MQTRCSGNCTGTDVSHWQGDINWELVRSDGISFAFIKATEGSDYTDPRFSGNLIEARKAGILVGAYHFCTPSDPEDALNEAGHFIKTVKKHGGFDLLDLPPVIDIEKNHGLNREQISGIVHAWVDRIKEVSGVQPLIYSYTYFIRDYLDETLGHIPLWLAHYDSNHPPDSAGWNSWLFLQYTDKGKIKGIPGNVDLNEYSGSREGLELLCRQNFI